MTGILSYGFYIPRYRITVDEFAKVWRKDPKAVRQSLGVEEKTVSASDEDTLTMAYEASYMALSDNNFTNKIGAVFVGSETHPYIVNPTATILAEFLSIEAEYLASDFEFACKAATGAMIAAVGLAQSDRIRSALVVGSDKANGKPQDALEYTASSGAVALVIGKGEVCVEIVDTVSFSSDTPDFWRREGNRYPSHGGRFTGKPAYFHHIDEASGRLFKKTKLDPKDFSHAVFHMPNGKFPMRIGLQLGFTNQQLRQSLVVNKLGNPYTASALMGLVSVLEIVREGDLIFMASFGSGAGSDAFVLRVTKHLKKQRRSLSQAMSAKEYIDYPTYLRHMDLL